MSRLLLGPMGVLLALATCGGRPLPAGGDGDVAAQGPTNNQCVAFCEKVRPKLLNNFGVPAAQINCLDSMWRRATSCKACLDVLRREYDLEALIDCDGAQW